jgi:hypothetical protein
MKRYESITCLQVISFLSNYFQLFEDSHSKFILRRKHFRDIEDLMLMAETNIFNIEDLVANGERRKHTSYFKFESKSSEN